MNLILTKDMGFVVLKPAYLFREKREYREMTHVFKLGAS